MERTVIVTGANGDIGRAIVKKFASNGDNVYALVGHNSSELEDFYRELMDQNGVWIKTCEADFMDEEAVSLALKEICKESAIDVLVNNAGLAKAKPLFMTPQRDIKDSMQVNFFTPSLIMQIVSKKMIKQKSGIIVNNISRCALEYRSGAYAYGSSKAALLWATKALAKELAPFNIRVNGIAPGLVETKMGSLGRSEEDTLEYVSKNNIKRPAKVEEIAEVIYFLTDETSSYISGQIINVDGGRD